MYLINIFFYLGLIKSIFNKLIPKHRKYMRAFTNKRIKCDFQQKNIKEFSCELKSTLKFQLISKSNWQAFECAE